MIGGPTGAARPRGPRPMGPMPAERAKELARRTADPVVDESGRRIGRLHDVYVADRGGEPVAVSVVLRGLRSRRVVVPVDLLHVSDSPRERIRVQAPAAQIKTWMAAPETGYLSAEELRKVAEEADVPAKGSGAHAQ